MAFHRTNRTIKQHYAYPKPQKHCGEYTDSHINVVKNSFVNKQNLIILGKAMNKKLSHKSLNLTTNAAAIIHLTLINVSFHNHPQTFPLKK